MKKKSGYTPLDRALSAPTNNVKIIKKLLKFGASFNDIHVSDSTVLHRPLQKRASFQVVEEILKHDVSINKKINMEQHPFLQLWKIVKKK